MRGLIKALRTAGLLIRHDLRVSFRAARGQWRGRSLAGILAMEGIAFILLHLFAMRFGVSLASAQASGSKYLLYATLVSATLYLFPWLISLATNNAVKAIYCHHDLDLVLSSPVPARAIFGSRSLVIASLSLIAPSLLVASIVDMSAWRAGIRWLCIYPVYLLESFLAAAIGLMITFLLFQMFGPRRTRKVVQIIASLVSLVSISYSQLINLQSTLISGRVSQSFASMNAQHFNGRAWYWLPIRAASGNTRDLVIWAALCVTSFVGVIVFLAPAFVSFAARAAGAPAAEQKSWSFASNMRFRGGPRRLIRINECRLLRRHSQVIPLVAQRMMNVFIFGMFFLFSPHVSRSAIGITAASMLVAVAYRLSGTFARMTLPDATAYDLMFSAPVDRAAVEISKLQAIIAPLAVLLLPPLCALAFFQPRTALWALAFIPGVVMCSAFFNLWRQLPDMSSQPKRWRAELTSINRTESFLSLCWAGALALALSHNILALAPVALALGMLYANRPSRLRRRRSRDQKPLGRAPAPC